MSHQLDVSTLFHRNGCLRFWRWALFHALSSGFPESLRFFQPLSPVAPSACLTVRLPGIAPGEGRGSYVPHSWSFRWLRCALYAGGATIPCRQL